MSAPKIKVVVLRGFKDGYDEFAEGETRFLEPERAEKFKSYGWVSVDGEKVKPFVGGADLSIHNGKLGQKAPTLGG